MESEDIFIAYQKMLDNKNKPCLNHANIRFLMEELNIDNYLCTEDFKTMTVNLNIPSIAFWDCNIIQGLLQQHLTCGVIMKVTNNKEIV